MMGLAGVAETVNKVLHNPREPVCFRLSFAYQSDPKTKRTCRLLARDGEDDMRGRGTLAIIGAVLMLAGGLLAHLTQTAGGIKIQDIRFKGAKGQTLSALLYIPPNASAQTPAPGILAVHGYVNSRETQDGFAIEFARRGYVVLALDQSGHGYSDGPAFANGFGGPDGLAYLRSLDIVDKANIEVRPRSDHPQTALAVEIHQQDSEADSIKRIMVTAVPQRRLRK